MITGRGGGGCEESSWWLTRRGEAGIRGGGRSDGFQRRESRRWLWGRNTELRRFCDGRQRMTIVTNLCSSHPYEVKILMRMMCGVRAAQWLWHPHSNLVFAQLHQISCITGR